MTHNNFEKLCDMATEAHSRFQQEIKTVNPVVGVSQSMRASGIPVDVMTIDCLKSDKRIILILNDEIPDSISYQFNWRDKDPTDNFTQVTFDDLCPDMIFEWMKGYLVLGIGEQRH